MVLNSLESSAHKTKPSAIAKDLPLFRESVAGQQIEKSPVLEELESLDPDRISPRDALDLLYKLKALHKK